MRVGHQVKTFQQLLQRYDGVLPLHRFLFTYFKQNRQMGSSDRRWAARYIYSFFRLGKALPEQDQILRLAIADFLCNQNSSLVIEDQLPQLADQLGLGLDEKLRLIKAHYPTFDLADVFGFSSKLSDPIVPADFQSSYFTQPDLFLRVESGHIRQLAAGIGGERHSFYSFVRYHHSFAERNQTGAVAS